MSYPLYPADPTADPAEPFRKLDTGPMTAPVATVGQRPGAWENVVDDRPPTAEELLERQRERFGGVKVGSAFFGLLITVAVGAILGGVLATAGAALGLGPLLLPRVPARVASFDAELVGWFVLSAGLAIVLVAFYCGGYVAGRMARFSGFVQGLAVWAWALVVAILAGVAGFLFGGRLVDDVTDRVDGFGRLLFPEDFVVIAAIIAAVVVAVAGLGVAMLGGMAGMRYHRRVDRVALDA
ncbi:hypothetical protein [Agromyces sp. H66]|uniref:hypothetical protein n=1 Tax=Agromyces sp. H66 TaxID=2529859 RepID=UPI0010A9C717|nr:hypothetical protein [Agromyces sp. H66]